MIKDINHQEFEKVILTPDKLVLIVFYVEASAGSYLVELSLNSIINKYVNKLEVYKVDIEKNPHLRNVYSLFSFPSLLFFKNNKLVDILKGATPKSVINKKIGALVNLDRHNNSSKNEIFNYN